MEADKGESRLAGDHDFRVTRPFKFFHMLVEVKTLRGPMTVHSAICSSEFMLSAEASGGSTLVLEIHAKVPRDGTQTVRQDEGGRAANSSVSSLEVSAD